MKFTVTKEFLDFFFHTHVCSLLTLPGYGKQFSFFQIMSNFLQKLSFYVENGTGPVTASSCQNSCFAAFK